jgi:hypothetical protein
MFQTRSLCPIFTVLPLAARKHDPDELGLPCLLAQEGVDGEDVDEVVGVHHEAHSQNANEGPGSVGGAGGVGVTLRNKGFNCTVDR